MLIIYMGTNFFKSRFSCEHFCYSENLIIEYNTWISNNWIFKLQVQWTILSMFIVENINAICGILQLIKTFPFEMDAVEIWAVPVWHSFITSSNIKINQQKLYYIGKIFRYLHLLLELFFSICVLSDEFKFQRMFFSRLLKNIDIKVCNRIAFFFHIRFSIKN